MGFFGQDFPNILILSFGAMSIGLILAYFSPASQTITQEFTLSLNEQSTFNALAPISAIFGGIFVGIIMSKLGRKLTAAMSSFIVLIGWVLLFFSQKSSKIMIFVSRIVSGIAAGATSGVTPVYISELSPNELRGSYGVMNQLFVSIGAMVSYFIGIFFNWRQIALFSSIPSLIVVLGIFVVPESPVTVNLDEKIGEESLWQAKFSKQILISVFLVVFQQLSGINAILTNLTPIFKASKISFSPGVAATLVGAAQVITTAIASPMVEKLGRKKSWVLSVSGQSIFLVLLWANHQFFNSTILPVVCLFFDVFMFGIGLGPLPWFVVPELFPDSVRSFACSIIQALNWLLCSSLIYLFNEMVKLMTIGWVYFFYGIIMCLAILFGLYILPETKGQDMGGENKKSDSRKIPLNVEL